MCHDPAHVPERVVEDCSNTWASVSCVGNLEEAPSSCLWPDPGLAIMAKCGSESVDRRSLPITAVQMNK